jgi:4-diphosphocytidyl-2-C-methyl-D-erythritol kinase
LNSNSKFSYFEFCWKIHLDKNVPTGAGLGGGSSNAATALWAANQFSGCLATEKELQEWSSEIGSDIPFIFSHGAAYCTGRGEVCMNFALSSKSKTIFLIPLHVSFMLSIADVRQ